MVGRALAPVNIPQLRAGSGQTALEGSCAFQGVYEGVVLMGRFPTAASKWKSSGDWGLTEPAPTWQWPYLDYVLFSTVRYRTYRLGYSDHALTSATIGD